MNQTSPPAPSERIAKQTFFVKMLETVVFLGNVCGTGPIAFPVVGFIAFAISYLIRVFSHASPPLLISGLFLVIIYYIFVGLFRLLVYNRHLDPLIAVPGPKVYPSGAWANFRAIGSKASIKSFATQKYSSFWSLAYVVDWSPAADMGKRIR